MDIVESAARLGFISQNCRKEFIERLSQTPPPSPTLIAAHPAEERLQGDVYSKMPFVILKSDGTFKSKDLMCMVLNNTCDLQPNRSEHCNFAAVAKYADFKSHMIAAKGEERATGFLKSIEANKVDRIFYSKDCPEIQGGVVVLLDSIATIPSALYDAALNSGLRHSSLSQFGFYQFLVKLTHFFARVETFEVTRESPPYCGSHQ